MGAATLALLVVIVGAVALTAGGMRLRITRSAEHGEPPAADETPTLQNALLPGNPPVVDGLRITWSHVAAGGASGGGDFYDAFFLDDGTLALTIGDAAGSGLAPIVGMNTVRQALRSAMIDGARPADALRRANRVLLRSEQACIVTALAGIIDPATLQFRYASAGHPAPLVATAGGCEALPDDGSGIALGAVPHHVASEHLTALPADAMLALYTDGCVPETPEALADAVSAVRELHAIHPAKAIDGAIFGRRARGADATIVTVTPEAQLAHLDIRLPAERQSAGLARVALRRFLAGTPLDDRRAFDAVVAVGEAVANAIEHAYDRRPNQTFVLRALFENDRCVFVIEDTGTWNEVEPLATRGRGIGMMRDLSDALEIERNAAGTTVALTFMLRTDVLADAALSAAS